MIEKFEAISKLNRAIELSSVISRQLIEVSKMCFDFAGSSPVTRSIVMYSPLGIEEI
jgi:hypothetical protein